MTHSVPPNHPFRVLIVGGGVAALEAALALCDQAGDRVRTTILTPDPDFVYRPMRVLEPFGWAPARHYPLVDIAHDIGAELIADRFQRLDAAASTVYTGGGQAVAYDALLVATGAQLQPAFGHAITIDDRRLDEQLHGLVQDVEQGYVRAITFIAPTDMAWPLPLYELALLMAGRAHDMQTRVAITICTPEDAPLAIFGKTVSDEVGELLRESGIVLLGSAHCSTAEPGVVRIHPGGRALRTERIVALPRLSGRHLPGLPSGRVDGFIPIDPHCRVPELDSVFAAGDATEFPIKHGGIASQQADAAAGAIAAMAGAPIVPRRFHPDIHSILLGAGKPLYLSAHVTGGHGTASRISRQPMWSPPSKIVAKYLSPYLWSLDHDSVVDQAPLPV